MTMLISGLVLFLGVHLLPAVPAARAGLVTRWGEERYKRIFSLTSALGLALIVAGFAYADRGARGFDPVPAARAIAPFAMSVSFILFAAANMRGNLRAFLRHPMLLGLLIWSGVHLLVNGDRAGTVLFGAFFAYAIVDLVSAVGRRAVRTFQPKAKHDVIAVLAGVAVALAIMTFHRVLFGVAVMPFGV